MRASRNHGHSSCDGLGSHTPLQTADERSLRNQSDDSHTSFGSRYFYAFPGLIFEVGWWCGLGNPSPAKITPPCKGDAKWVPGLIDNVSGCVDSPSRKTWRRRLVFQVPTSELPSIFHGWSDGSMKFSRASLVASASSTSPEQPRS